MPLASWPQTTESPASFKAGLSFPTAAGAFCREADVTDPEPSEPQRQLLLHAVAGGRSSLFATGRSRSLRQSPAGPAKLRMPPSSATSEQQKAPPSISGGGTFLSMVPADAEGRQSQRKRSRRRLSGLRLQRNHRPLFSIFRPSLFPRIVRELSTAEQPCNTQPRAPWLCGPTSPRLFYRPASTALISLRCELPVDPAGAWHP